MFISGYFVISTLLIRRAPSFLPLALIVGDKRLHERAKSSE